MTFASWLYMRVHVTVLTAGGQRAATVYITFSENQAEVGDSGGGPENIW